MVEGFNTKELTKFENELVSLAIKEMPRRAKGFMKKEGNKLKKRTLSRAKTVVKSSGNNTEDGKQHKKYHNSIKRGKPYHKDGKLCIRAYSNAPHAHLLEYGHRQVVNPGKGRGNGRGVEPGRGIGREIGFVPGRHVFSGAADEFQDDYYRDTQDFIDDVLDKGLS
ncbi:HK97 gp10 family phage protein [Anaerotignum sp. MB30-C6]|uniref:HK97 gp10 family phage protein n=1 Tax=Anaerotignum sp. MB30-C6 TaxID=3070814 RepID=UPI0027DB3430|nr:HK97 gp10 family phage protein [Anaerotignum sp. MB30-C6]WMI80905.1 HK97 gp10 family phage protein [Anaerotignum sp. MB30-C6]